MRVKKEKILVLENLPDILTPQLVADYMGISRSRVYEHCLLKPEFGGLPSYLIGGSRKIDKADLINWKNKFKNINSKTG